jgi:hypothetical protein
MVGVKVCDGWNGALGKEHARSPASQWMIQQLDTETDTAHLTDIPGCTRLYESSTSSGEH